jgi:hypothetical protein
VEWTDEVDRNPNIPIRSTDGTCHPPILLGLDPEGFEVRGRIEHPKLVRVGGQLGNEEAGRAHEMSTQITL